MAKTMTLAAFLVCISCALAADASSAMVTPTSTLPSQTSHQPLASSTTAASPSPSPPMMSSAVPVPSPTPDRPIIPDSKYIVRRDDGMVCIRMEAEIETTVTYETAVGTNTSVLVVSGNATVSNSSSMCNDTYAKMVLVWNGDQTNLTFAFSADDSGWREEGVRFEYVLSNVTLFPGYQDSSNHTLGIAMFGNLLGRDSNSNNQSFLCNATQTFNSHDTDNITNATLIVRDLRMQAFHFTNSSTGQFDSAYDCAGDQSTNKIVPIVVGAALAGLVIVVLIAYLIGRFRNRKQSSYEALS